ncbi:hypothetical protein [Fusobacterium necrophorum]|uniref:hypothetical protein n=1 Tax=Fusobacterium necrophorum TaxID=859 RepID=UPI00370ED94F
MKYVFSKEKCLLINKIDPNKALSWMEECDGKEVDIGKDDTYGFCGPFLIKKEWCEVVRNENI